MREAAARSAPRAGIGAITAGVALERLLRVGTASEWLRQVGPAR